MKLLLAIPVVAMILGGCASNPTNGPVYDPYENVNRAVYSFNDALDRAILKPVARGYRYVTPDIVEIGVNNFFSNLDDVNVIANDLLQGKFRQAGLDTGRFLYNSTAGILGIWDVSTRAGLVKHNESFGQTLGVWGVGEGPYLYLPFLGPNNARTTVGQAVESVTTDVPNQLIDHTPTRLGVRALDIIALRARLLAAGNLLNAAALDPYLLLRDFWVQQHRRATCDNQCDTRIGTSVPDDGDELDDLDALDALDELDELDALDAMDELDKLDAMDELDELDAMDELDQLDELDELDRLDALDELEALE